MADPRYGLPCQGKVGVLTMRRECEASVIVAAPPEAVWAVVSDVTRVGEWSGECRACVWLGEAVAPVPGARFRGCTPSKWVSMDTSQRGRSCG